MGNEHSAPRLVMDTPDTRGHILHHLQCHLAVRGVCHAAREVVVPIFHVKHVCTALSPSLLRYALACGMPKAHVCSLLASTRDDPMLTFATSLGCPWDALVTWRLAHHANIHMFNWARTHGRVPCDATTMMTAACANHFRVVRLLYEIGCPWDPLTCWAAAFHGDMAILRWVRKRGCPWGPDTIAAAASFGYLVTIRWARSKGCPWDATAINAAADAGLPSTLRWLHKNGCPWDETVCTTLAKNGDLDMLKWVRERGCPWDQTVRPAAVEHPELLAWAEANGCPM